MPLPKGIPPDAGYPGLPINDMEPVLKAGFAYYNEEIRPRREFLTELGENGEWRKMEFGKPGGELYPIWSTTPWDLREFGLGVAMYFQTLQLLCVTFFLCGLMQAQAVQYYKGEKYSDGQVGVAGMIRGSAVCTRNAIVCLDEECLEIGKANLCHMGQMQAYFDLGMTVLLLILFTIVSLIQNKVSNELDESIQTAQDYSVLIDDPGPEDFDPDEWQQFFVQFGHVTFVTVAKNNGPLLTALADRRAVMREIIMMIGNGTPSDKAEEDDDGVLDTTWEGLDFKSKMRSYIEGEAEPPVNGTAKVRGYIAMTGFFGMKKMSKWRDALAKCNEKVQMALDQHAAEPYIASKVFITFETEIGQRRCLKALSQGVITAAFDMGKSTIDPNYLFKGENVLAIKEACEPNEVFWEDVDITFKKRVKQQSYTLFITLLIVCGSVVICKQLQIGTGAGGAALWISVTNILVPVVIRMLCFSVEDHVSLTDQQLSLFLKLTFFRWMNTAVVLYAITNFDEFLTEEAMTQVQAVLFADALTTPLIRTLDPTTLINQLIVCNYAITQEKMNWYFTGTPWFPAERYADMTKTLFLALFYSSLFPSGLFLTCGGYGFCYMVDKFSLLRSWRTPAELGDEITKVSRGHMFFAVFCHAVMTMIFFSEFPFDNICVAHPEKPTILSPHVYHDAVGMYNVTTDLVHTRCDQTVLGRLLSIFGGGSIERDSMYGRQRRIVKLYVYLVMGLSVILIIGGFGISMVMGCWHLFKGSYKSMGNASDIHYSKCEILAYIPFIRHSSLAYPLICADVSAFESRFLPFELPDETLYKTQSLFNRGELPGFSDDEMKALFSEIKFYPPPDDLVELPDNYKEVAQDSN